MNSLWRRCPVAVPTILLPFVLVSACGDPPGSGGAIEDQPAYETLEQFALGDCNLAADDVTISGATGTGGQFVIDDQVKVAIDTAGIQDDNDDAVAVVSVAIDLLDWGGSAAAVAANDGGGCDVDDGDEIWTACHTLDDTGLDDTNAVASISIVHAGVGTPCTGDPDAEDVDTTDPAPTQGEVTLSGHSGDNDTFLDGDTVTVTWDNTAATGDDIGDADSATANLTDFGGGAAVAMVNAADEWTASFTLVGGIGDITDASVTITVTDDAGNDGTATTVDEKIDDVVPVVTTAKIAVSGDSGTGGTFVAVDTVTAVWDNSAGTGDNNADTISSVNMDFSDFGGSATVAATDDGVAPDVTGADGKWTASAAVAGARDVADADVTVTPKDNAGNTAAADSDDDKNDTIDPVVTQGNIAVTNNDSAGNPFRDTHEVKVEWDSSAATGDNNADISSVAVDLSDFGGAADAAALDGGAGCDDAADDDIWTVCVDVTGVIDRTDAIAAVTATDDAGNTGTANSANQIVDTVAPVATDANVSTAGHSGDNDTFLEGDTVTVTWDNTAGGDNIADVDSVTVDLGDFGGGAAVAMVEAADEWTAAFTLVGGIGDITNARTTITVTDDGLNTDTAQSPLEKVDDVDPVVTTANIAVTGHGGDNDTFVAADTVTAVWDDSGTGDDNADTISSVNMDFSDFGGSATVAATDDGVAPDVTGADGKWTASAAVAGARDVADADVTVTPKDNAGNTAAADSDDDKNDTIDPVVTQGNIAVTNNDSAGNPFRDTHEVKVEWDTSAGTGDNNADISSVAVDLTDFGGAADAAALDGGAGCDDAADDDVWTVCVDVTGVIDRTDAVATVTATDDAGNTGSADSADQIVDTVAPVVTDGNVSSDGHTGDNNTFVDGDVVRVIWDNRNGAGDNILDVDSITVDFTEFGGGDAVVPVDDGSEPIAGCEDSQPDDDQWTACAAISAVGDVTDANAIVTVTDDGLNTDTAVSPDEKVDDVDPVLTQGNLTVDNITADGDPLQDGHVARLQWDNSAAGDENADTISAVTIDVADFTSAANPTPVDDGSTPVAGCTDDVADDDIWTACITVDDDGGEIDRTDAQADWTAEDDAGNTTTTSTSNVVVDTDPPVPSQGAVTLSGHSGDNDTFVEGDTVTVTWDNTAGTGDDITDADSATADLTDFGGGAAVVMVNVADEWTASFTLVGGLGDIADASATVTVTDDGLNTGEATSVDEKVDDVDPVITTASIAVTGHTGDNDTFVAADTVTAVWDNSGTGDDNADTISSVNMDFSDFGGSATVAATDDGVAPDTDAADGKWTASAAVAGARDVADADVTVTPKDNAGNTASADSDDEKNDTIDPVVTTGNIAVTNNDSAGNPFRDTHEVKVEWDTSAGTGDNNADISSVAVDLTDFGGAADAVALDDGNGCDDAIDDVWTVCVDTAGVIDRTDAVATVTATDDAGNTGSADSAQQIVDTVDPGATDANVSTAGHSGDNDTFVEGDTVTVTWDNTAGGDNVLDAESATADFGDFGGGNAVVMVEAGDEWTASFTLVGGVGDVTNARVTITVTDDGLNTDTAQSPQEKVDDVVPVVTAGNIALSGDTGDNDTFVATDTVTAVWDNSAGTGDNNADTISSVSMNFSDFGGGAAVVATDDGVAPDTDAGDGKWTARAAVAGARDVADADVTVTPKDNAGNTAAADSADEDNDTIDPTVTQAKIAVTNNTDAGQPFTNGDEVKLVWDNTVATGDNNADTIASVAADLTDFGAAADEVMLDDGVGCDAAAGDRKWTICVNLGGGVDSTTATADVTPKDNAGNTATASSTDQNVDDDAPAPANGDVATFDHSGDNDTFVDVDVVRATWDNSGGGVADVDSVAFDLADFGGGGAVAAVDDGSSPIAGCADSVSGDDIWTACAEITGARDVADAAAVVTVTDDGTNTGTATGPAEKVDTVDPAPNGARIATTGHTGTNDTFVSGDTVTVVWDNTDDHVPDDASVAVNFTEFGGGAAVAAVEDNGEWTATATVTGVRDVTDANVVVTVTDDAGNTGAANGGDELVDSQSPTVTAGNIIVCGAAGGIFVAGDTVTAVWDNRAAGDNNGDLRAADPVQVNFFGIDGATAEDAAANVAACNLAANAQRWVASYTLQAGDLDALSQNVRATATDDAGNATTTTDDGNYNVDTTTPTLTAGNIHVCGHDADDLFQNGDTITVVWDNRAGGDNNGDMKAADPVQVNFFDIAGANAKDAANDTAPAQTGDCDGIPSNADVWVATHVVAVDDLDTTAVAVVVTITDDGEQSVQVTDDGVYDVDATVPVVTDDNIEVCGDGGDGYFQAGETVTVHWDNRGAPAGDGNVDLRAATPVSVNFFGIADATAINASNQVAGCGVAQNDDIWVATYELDDDDLDDDDVTVTVSVTDDGKHTTTTVDTDGPVDVDTAEPIVTAGNIHVCGHTASRFTHKAGENLVTVVWDNRAGGDNNTDLNADDPVAVDFFGIAGAGAVVATNNTEPAQEDGCDGIPSNANVWVATYTVQQNDIDDVDRKVSVTATDHADYATTTEDDTGYTVDGVIPTVTNGNIHVCGDGGDGIFRSGDEVTVVWDNRAGGDNNTDLRDATPVKVNFFDLDGDGGNNAGFTANAAADIEPIQQGDCDGIPADAQVWVATRTLVDDEIDDSATRVYVRAQDDALLASRQQDDTDYNVDTTEPVVEADNIHICGETGTDGTFRIGDTVTVAWDNRATGDDNVDLKAAQPVKVNFFGLDGGTARVATNNGAVGATGDCDDLDVAAGVWVATFALTEQVFDEVGQLVAVSATDDALYTTTTNDDVGQKVDLERPIVQAADFVMDTDDASGTDGYFIVEDRVRFEWDGTDNPAGEIASVTVDLSGFGGDGAEPARDDGATVGECVDAANANRIWTACYDVDEADPEDTGVIVEILATDNAGNTQAGADGDGYDVDGVSPTVDLDAHLTFTYGEGVDIKFRPAYFQGFIYDWTFGDGGVANGQGAANRNPVHSYDDQGVYDVDVTVTDNHGNTGAHTHEFTITNQDPAPNPQAVTDLGDDAAPGGAGDDADTLISESLAIEEIDPVATFTVRNTTDPSPVDVTSLQYIWDFGDGESFAFGPDGVDDAEFVGTGVVAESCTGYADCEAVVGCDDYDSCKLAVAHNFFQGRQPVPYTVTLTATDKDGGTADAEYLLQVTDVVPVPEREAINGAMDEADSDNPVEIRVWIGGDDGPSLNVAYTFTIAWKDGAVQQVGPLLWDGVNDVEATLTHVYDDDPDDGDTYPVTVSVITHTGTANTAPDLHLTVNNLPPTAVGRETPGQTPVEGLPVSFEAAGFDGASSDPSPFDTLTYSWDFDTPGDCGNLDDDQLCPGFDEDATGPTASNTYGDDGAYQVCVRAEDDDGGQDDDCFEVVVRNVAPVAVPPVDKQDAIEGIAFELTASALDVANDEVAAYVWELTNCALLDQVGATATFVCRDDGLFIGWVSANDGEDSDPNDEVDDGLGPPAEFNVFVSNVRPNAKACVSVNAALAPNAGQLNYDQFPPNNCAEVGEVSVDEAADVVFAAAGVDRGIVGDISTATLDDVDPNALLYTWNMGDGALPKTGQVITHAFNRVQDRYVVELTTQDKDGGRDVQAIVVNVGNVAPNADSVVGITDAADRKEGAPIWFRGSGSDTAGDSLTYIWTAWPTLGRSCANVNGQPLAQKDGVDLREVSFTFTDNGDYLICLSIRDSAQADSDPAELRIDVLNVAPTANAGPERLATEGGAITLVGSARDPGANEELEYRWSFGDCIDEAGGDADPDAGFDGNGRSVAHVYVNEILPVGCDDPFDGGFLATLQVRDKDGGVDQDTVRVLVGNVAPVMPLLPPVRVVEGIDATIFPEGFTLVAEDPGAQDTLSYVFSWGDGEPDSDPVVRVPQGPQGRALDAITEVHRYAQDGRYTGRVCVADNAADPGDSCRSFTVLADNYRPVVVPVHRDDGRGQPGQRMEVEFQQGVDNCLPVLVQDFGLQDHAGTSCRLANSPAGMTVQPADIGADRFPDLGLAAHEHDACWLCWNPPESAIGDEGDDPFLVRVRVQDDRSFVTQDWAIDVVLSDDDQDQMPNTFELDHQCFEPDLRQGDEGCTPCLDKDADNGAGDPDVDGVTSLQEYQRGTNPCASDAPSAPGLIAPVDGGELRSRPGLLVVSNAFDPNVGQVLRAHHDLQPLRYLFAIQSGEAAPAAPAFADVGRQGCEDVGVLPGAQTTLWPIDLPGDAVLIENSDYAWAAYACDGFAIGPGTGGSFFFNELDEPPSAPVMRSPFDKAENQPLTPEFVWSCSSDVDRDVVRYELELRVQGESRPFLVQALPPCEAEELLGRHTLTGGLASNRWYEWKITAIDTEGLRTPGVGRLAEEGEPQPEQPPWAFLINPDNRCPSAPTLLSPISDPVPPATERLPGVTVAEVATLTPELKFRAPLVPDLDGNPVHYRIDVDVAETFDSPDKVSSPPLQVTPGAEAAWTVAGGMLADDTFYWWRVVAVDAQCDGEPAVTLIFTNTGSGPPTPGGEGDHRNTDTQHPVIVADRPPPADPDGDLFSCQFELVRLVDGQTECTLPDLGECGEGVGFCVEKAAGITPEETGAVAWQVSEAMQNRHPHCWRHKCCDDDQLCGDWSSWFPLTIEGPNQCPSGIALIGPNSDDQFDLDGPDVLELIVQDAEDPDNATALSYEFEIYSDPHLATNDRIFARAVVQGDDGKTRLVIPQGGDAMTAVRVALGGRSVGTFYWRARAVDGRDCASEWTKLGRFVVERPILGDEGCACEIRPGATSSTTDLSGAWLLGLLGLVFMRRRGAATRRRTDA